MSNPYLPSNAWEGMAFQESWCMRCKHEPTCPILTTSYFEPVAEWVIDAEGARCTAFEEEADDE